MADIDCRYLNGGTCVHKDNKGATCPYSQGKVGEAVCGLHKTVRD